MLKYFIAVSGWVVMGLYFYYDSQEYGPMLLDHLFSVGRPARTIFHVLMLLAPVMSMYTAYLLKQRERLSRELLAKEKMESLSAMTGGIATDFQSLLSSVSGHIAEAKRAPDLSEEARRTLEEAERVVACVRERILELRAFSKGMRPETQVTIVEDVLTDICESEIIGTGLSCHYDIPGDIWPGGIDRAMLKKSLSGIVRHAVNNAPASGTVFVSCRNVSVGVHSALPLTRGDYVCMTVRYEGPRLSDERLRRLFEPYADGTDTGLSLATAFSIIQQNGGCVTAASDEGTGISMLVYVPVPSREGPGSGVPAP